MPVYNYLAKDFEGNNHKGEVETVSDLQAANLLRRKHLIVISIKAKNLNKNKFLGKFFNRVAFSDIVICTRQLATMISAGLVLSEAIDALSEQQTNKTFKSALEGISSDVKGGAEFAAAVEKYPDVFPPLYSRLIKAGQASGHLDTILENLAKTLEKQREFESKLRGAMIYPVVVITMMVGVMLVMIFFVMPKLMGMYKDSGLKLPLPTRIMLGFSDFMLSYWWAVLIVIIVVIVGFKKYSQSPGGKLFLDTNILKLPIIGRIATLSIMTNFTRTFALLISSGLPILESIKIVSEIVGNAAYREAFEITYKAVERGLSFSDQISALPVFPKLVAQMAKTGEQTGKLDEVFSKIADYFESEADNTLKNITTLIEPIILVILGIGVALLVISIIMPIYQLTTNIK